MSRVEFPKHWQPEKQVFFFCFVAVINYRSEKENRSFNNSVFVYNSVYSENVITEFNSGYG